MSNTKSGYHLAHPGDSINTAFLSDKPRRGRVGNQIAHTLTTSPTQAVFIDLNIDPKTTTTARCITAKYDAGIGKHKAERSGVLITGSPEDLSLVAEQNGVVKAIYVIRVTTDSGVIWFGVIRKLMPLECWRLQGFTDEQFRNPSESLQMIERPLLTPDELKSLPKGSFVVMKTGVHPMQVKLKLFFEWGIQFDEDNPYTVPEHGNRKVEYAEKKEIMDGIVAKYHPDWLEEPMPADDSGFSGGQDHVPAELHEPQQHAPRTPDKRRAGSGVNPAPPVRRQPISRKPEVKSDGQV